MSNEHGRRHRSLCSNDVVRSRASSPVCNLMVHLSVITWRLWLCDEWCCDSAAIPTRLAPRTLQHYRPSLSCFSFWPLVSQQQHVRKHCAGANGRLKIAKTSSLGPPYSQTLVQPGARATRCVADPCAGRCSGSQKSLYTTRHYFLFYSSQVHMPPLRERTKFQLWTALKQTYSSDSNTSDCTTGQQSANFWHRHSTTAIKRLRQTLALLSTSQTDNSRSYSHFRQTSPPLLPPPRHILAAVMLLLT